MQGEMKGKNNRKRRLQNGAQGSRKNKGKKNKEKHGLSKLKT